MSRVKRSRVRVFERVGQIPQAAWDALQDEAATPFVRWAWLEALEASGCAAPSTGWTGQHLTLWRDGALVAAAPAYLKSGSDGDFSRDWGWARAIENAGFSYYPKLCITVPFTPVTGRRILVAPGEDRACATAALLDAALALVRGRGLATLQVLFPDEPDTVALEQAGLQRRVDFQYHWFNPGYRTAADFLGRFDSKHRNMLRRERAAPAKQGIQINTVRGEALARDPERYAHLAYAFHRNTVDKLLWGRHWLNERFYLKAFSAMPEHMELVVAEREERPIAGAFNVSAGGRLYGRYWGCIEEHPFLHFNVCYNHSIEACIARGVTVFEGGAGGEHKIARGFEPAPTWSAHTFVDKKLDHALRAALSSELAERNHALAQWVAEGRPFARPFTASATTQEAP